MRIVSRFPLIKPARASFLLFCLVIHSRMYGQAVQERDVSRLTLGEEDDAAFASQSDVFKSMTIRRSFPSARISDSNSVTFSLSIRPLSAKTTSPLDDLRILSMLHAARGCTTNASRNLLKLKHIGGQSTVELHQIGEVCTTTAVGQAPANLERSVPLKRFLLIFSVRIFDSRVDRGMPSFSAAPQGPYTRPPHSRRAASIIAFSSAGGVRNRSRRISGPVVATVLAGEPALIDGKSSRFTHDDGSLDHVL